MPNRVSLKILIFPGVNDFGHWFFCFFDLKWHSTAPSFLPKNAHFIQTKSFWCCGGEWRWFFTEWSETLDMRYFGHFVSYVRCMPCYVSWTNSIVQELHERKKVARTCNWITILSYRVHQVLLSSVWTFPKIQLSVQIVKLSKRTIQKIGNFQNFPVKTVILRLTKKYLGKVNCV